MKIALITFLFSTSALAAVDPIQLNRSMIRLAGIMGVNLLPNSRVKVYEGKTTDNRPCAVDAEIFGGRYTLNGIGVSVALVSNPGGMTLKSIDEVSFLLSRVSSQSVYEQTSFGRSFFQTLYRNPEMSQAQNQSIDISSRLGKHVVSVTSNGKTLTCEGFTLESQAVE